MAVLMVTRGRPMAPFEAVVGRVTDTMGTGAPADTVLLCRERLPEGDLSAYAALLLTPDVATPVSARAVVCNQLDHLSPDDLISVNGETGTVRTVFRPASTHNALFVTERCNSNCLMCSQPPKATDDDSLLGTNLRIVELLKDCPPLHIGISGGEPTLLGDGLLRLLTSLKDNLPSTYVSVLSNGRRLGETGLCSAIAGIQHPRLRFTIPLHADVPDVHDHIAQAKGAFYETVNGFYNLAAHGIDMEVRVVLHALSVPRLPELAEWIWRKLPFVRQVAFMGLENMGYVKKNWQHLWIDPVDYAEILKMSAMHLYRRGIDVSIYNLPLCVLPTEVWAFARQSISDHKQILLGECESCEVASHCSGFFKSSENRHSSGVQAVRMAEIAKS